MVIVVEGGGLQCRLLDGTGGGHEGGSRLPRRCCSEREQSGRCQFKVRHVCFVFVSDEVMIQIAIGINQLRQKGASGRDGSLKDGYN